MPIVLDNETEDVYLQAGTEEDWGIIPGKRSNLDRETLAKIERECYEHEELKFTDEEKKVMDEQEAPFIEGFENNKENTDTNVINEQTKFHKQILKSLKRINKNQLTFKTELKPKLKLEEKLSQYSIPTPKQKKEKPQDEILTYFEKKRKIESRIKIGDVQNDFGYDLSSEMDLDDVKIKFTQDSSDEKGIPVPKSELKEQNSKIKSLLNVLSKSWKTELDEEFKQEKEDHEGHPLMDVIREDKRLSSYSEGQKYFNRGLEAVHRMGIKPTPTQLDFIRKMFDVCIPHIYKDEFPKFREHLLQAMRKQNFQRGAFLACPRQFGKSTMVALACAALLLIGRGINIVVVANSQDIASKMMKMIIEYYSKLAEVPEYRTNVRIVMSNQRMACVARADNDPSMSNAEIRQKGLFNMIRACSVRSIFTALKCFKN